MGLADALRGGPIYLDANILIYWLEDYARYAPALEPLFLGIEQERFSAHTSALTLGEILVKPLRDRRQGAAARFEAFLCNSPDLVLWPISNRILIRAAGMRAVTSLKLPDAIHSATAEEAGCRAVVTNDREMKANLGDMCFLLDDYLTET